MSELNKTLLLFDVDGTLTLPMKHIDDEMYSILLDLKNRGYDLAIVGGSNIQKINKQLGDKMYEVFSYIFSENGVIAYQCKDINEESGYSIRNVQQIHDNSILNYLGETNYQELIFYIMLELVKIKIPKKRGNFIELRKACLNVSPIGRSCTYDERVEFNNYDNKNNIRKSLCNRLDETLDRFGLQSSIGGMISIDIFPKGWDKTYCLQFIKDKYTNIIFFGDKTNPGENDYEIYTHKDIEGFSVSSPEDTKKYLKQL